MSQKKASRNRLRKLNLIASSIPEECGQVALAHLMWSLPQEEMRERFSGAGRQTVISIVGKGDSPELSIGFTTEDALRFLDVDVDDDMIQEAADQYHDFFDPLYPEGKIATLKVDRADGMGSTTVVTIRPEDYDVE